jgi:hypothetical protein
MKLGSARVVSTESRGGEPLKSGPEATVTGGGGGLTQNLNSNGLK